MGRTSVMARLSMSDQPHKSITLWNFTLSI